VASADYEDRAFDSVVPLQRFWQRRRHVLVTGLVDRGRRTLDVGCGSSRVLGALPRGSIGVDLLIRKLRHARRFDRRLVQASALRLPFRDGAFEQVVCSNLLELVPRDGKALDEIVRVLAPAGRLIVSTPDYGRWHWVLASALYERLVPGAGESPYLGRYTKAALVAELAGRGCALEASRSILGAEAILAFRRA